MRTTSTGSSIGKAPRPDGRARSAVESSDMDSTFALGAILLTESQILDNLSIGPIDININMILRP